MLLNVGGGDHQSYGVHAHMNVDHDIYYAAEDEKRQKITWVKSVGKNGNETVFTAPDSRWKDSPPSEAEIRKMDCIDCHNRPTHQFSPPYRFMNDALQYGVIDASIPKIKEKSLELLSKEYKSAGEARHSIEKALKEYYESDHPEYYAANRAAVESAAREIIKLFESNIFPEMKTRWDTHPDNIGHLVTPGCFRCHDGEHRSAKGKIISRDCRSCHLIVEQGPMGSLEKNIEGLDFQHPPGGDEWKEMNCADCHTGGA